jgi:hypothetical protein
VVQGSRLVLGGAVQKRADMNAVCTANVYAYATAYSSTVTRFRMLRAACSRRGAGMQVGVGRYCSRACRHECGMHHKCVGVRICPYASLTRFRMLRAACRSGARMQFEVGVGRYCATGWRLVRIANVYACAAAYISNRSINNSCAHQRPCPQLSCPGTQGLYGHREHRRKVQRMGQLHLTFSRFHCGRCATLSLSCSSGRPSM